MGNPRVLVIGDHITDIHRICRCTRMCPEAPVPVLVEDHTYVRNGGAANVATQLQELLTDGEVGVAYGSISVKERIFSDGRLICRLDKDSTSVMNRTLFQSHIQEQLRQKTNLIIISDYGKGALDAETAELIMEKAKQEDIPVFVDAKTNWHLYPGAFAFFPNRHETPNPLPEGVLHVIQKLGERGCSVDGEVYAPEGNHEVRDVTGAGDVFLAAFAYRWLQTFDQTTQPDFPPVARLRVAAWFANRIAGLSVEHLGTYVVPKKLTESF